MLLRAVKNIVNAIKLSIILSGGFTILKALSESVIECEIVNIVAISIICMIDFLIESKNVITGKINISKNVNDQTLLKYA